MAVKTVKVGNSRLFDLCAGCFENHQKMQAQAEEAMEQIQGRPDVGGESKR